VLDVVKQGIAAVIGGVGAAVEAERVVEGAADRPRARLRIEVSEQPQHLHADCRSVGGADAVGNVVIVAAHQSQRALVAPVRRR